MLYCGLRAQVCEQVPELGDVQLRRGLAVASQRLWLQQASDAGPMSDLHREVAATLTALGEPLTSTNIWRKT